MDVTFPIFEVLVNYIFGSIGLALVFVFAVIILILALCKTSWVFIIYWSIFYITVMMTFYLGGIGLVLMAMLSLFYLIAQIIRLVFPDY
jgi:hypothetical protein